MAKKPSRKTRRTQAARERAREAHVRVTLQRQGDPRYVQQTRTETGRVVHLRPSDIDALRRQQELFVEKFGREPGPDDPVFFDPTKDEPTEMDPEAAFPEIRAAAVKAGVDPAFIDAWAEVGYIVTDANQHLFSAHEVEAYEDAVERAQDRNVARGGDADPFADDTDAAERAEGG